MKKIISIAGFTMLLNFAFAQIPQKTHVQMAKDTSLANSLYLLEMWGERPSEIRQFATLSHKILSQHFKADFDALSKDREFDAHTRKYGMLLLGGPMLGNITSTSATIWVRTARPAKVEVAVILGNSEKIFGPVNSSTSTDLSAVVKLDGLSPGTTYSYRVLIDGQAMPGQTFIRTLPAKGSQDPIRIAFGTCFHRWGLGNKTQARTIVERNPHALLLGGDIAVQDRRGHLGLHRFDYLMRDLFPAWQLLASAVPVYATWDDHDYFDDDLAGIPTGFTNEDQDGVWQVFRKSWNNPSYGFGENGKGVFFRTRIGPADVIMLDNRYFRSGEKGSFLGEQQMEWLKNQLLDCKGPFIILSCGTMWSDYVSKGKDSWGQWDPEGREQIFRLIEEHKIGGVLLISGDRHGARGFRIPRPSGFSFYEFEPGSLGGRSGPPAINPEWETQLFGFDNEYAFGEFTFNTSLPDPEVTFRLVHEEGRILYELTLKRSQLTPK
jgi:alkaline phosphatase D